MMQLYLEKQFLFCEESTCKLCPPTLFSSSFLFFWAVTIFVAMPSAWDAGSGVWEHLFSEIDCANLLWVDFCFKFVKGLSVWTVAPGYSLSPGLGGLWIRLGISLVRLPQACSLKGSSILKGYKPLSHKPLLLEQWFPSVVLWDKLLH